MCEIEYRRVSGAVDAAESEGGWPETNQDILAALTKLYDEITYHNKEATDSYLLDPSRIFFIGHSAGGCLALWACCDLAAKDLPFEPFLCLAIAPVCDLIDGAARKY